MLVLNAVVHSVCIVLNSVLSRTDVIVTFITNTFIITVNELVGIICGLGVASLMSLSRGKKSHKRLQMI
jgi:MFS superfamily sulfate permease-like transporter